MEDQILIACVIIIFIIFLFYWIRSSRNLCTNYVGNTNLLLTNFGSTVINHKDNMLSAKLPSSLGKIDVTNSQIWQDRHFVGNVMSVVVRDGIGLFIMDRTVHMAAKKITIIAIN